MMVACSWFLITVADRNRLGTWDHFIATLSEGFIALIGESK